MGMGRDGCNSHKGHIMSVLMDKTKDIRHLLDTALEENKETGVYRCRRDIFTNPDLFELEMKHIFEGNPAIDVVPKDVFNAIVGMKEIFVPIVSMTITLAAVYAPIGFTQGLTGSLFREFAFTLAGAVIISGIIAVTLTPMMSSKLPSSSESDALLTMSVPRSPRKIPATQSAYCCRSGRSSPS